MAQSFEAALATIISVAEQAVTTLVRVRGMARSSVLVDATIWSVTRGTTPSPGSEGTTSYAVTSWTATLDMIASLVGPMTMR